MVTQFDMDREVTWCPGCGNFPILTALKQVLEEMAYQPADVLIVSGIGQAGKLSQYVNVNSCNVLHGRTLPVATGATLVEPRLKVIAVGGDGDGYAEGGNHIIHAARRNVDVTCLIHNNQVYGLTKGQASPTTDRGTKTTTTPRGNLTGALNPIMFLLGIQASFVARGFAGDREQLAVIMKAALDHPGFAVVDILQPCVTFNKVNTYDWYRERVYDVGEQGHDPSDLARAFALALEWGERIPTGVFYVDHRPTLREAAGVEPGRPPVDWPPGYENVQKMMDKLR